MSHDSRSKVVRPISSDRLPRPALKAARRPQPRPLLVRLRKAGKLVFFVAIGMAMAGWLWLLFKFARWLINA